jgi:hypothetical protein
MKTLQTADTTMVKDLYAMTEPVLSVYFGLADPARDDLALRRRAVMEALARSKAEAAAVKDVGRVLDEVQVGFGSLAVFAGRDGGATALPMPGAQIPDHAAKNAVPHVVPYLRWRQQNPSYVLAMLDRAGADVTVQPAAGGTPQVTTVQGPDDEIVRNAPGGWSQSRHQNRAEDSWQHNSGRAAEVAGEALAASGARLLLVGGDVRAVQYFQDRLPAWVGQDVAIKAIPGSRHPDGSHELRPWEIADVTRAYTEERARQCAGDVNAQSGPDGLGVQGIIPTMHALARGQVHTLLIAPALSVAEPAVAWFGRGPMDISDHRSGITSPETPAFSGPIVEVMVRAAVMTGADVVILPADPNAGPGPDAALEAGSELDSGAPTAADFGLRQGVGAMCRFSMG